MAYHERLSRLDHELDIVLAKLRVCPDDDDKEAELNEQLRRLLDQHQAVLDEIEALEAEAVHVRSDPPSW